MTRATQVDHFLAWSRWPNDAIENLVLADTCNGDRSDHLAAPAHVDRWIHRLPTQGADPTALAQATRWTTDGPRSTALVRTTYGHLVAGIPPWIDGKRFTQSTGPVELTI